jgi:hypothetical protein
VGWNRWMVCSGITTGMELRLCMCQICRGFVKKSWLRAMTEPMQGISASARPRCCAERIGPADPGPAPALIRAIIHTNALALLADRLRTPTLVRVDGGSIPRHNIWYRRSGGWAIFQGRSPLWREREFEKWAPAIVGAWCTCLRSHGCGHVIRHSAKGGFGDRWR